MGLVQVGVKMDISIRERIKALVNEGKYRDMTDFAVKAILEKLEREEMDERTRLKIMMLDLILSDPDIREAIDDAVISGGDLS
jgi:Arc/MetJ-type ribon-helix-helix transcriptional regulator